MRTTKGAVITLLLAVMLLATRQSALGQSDVAIPESFITVDKTAPGTKVPGTLTIYYEPTTNCPNDGKAEAIFFFMRLQTVQNGKFQTPFSGDLSGEHLCLLDTSGQQVAIEDFIRDEVIPDLFSCNQPSCPPFALKSVDQFVEEFKEPLFVMVDFVLAVQEK